MLFALIIFALIGLLTWANSAMVRQLRRRHAAIGWWVLLIVLWTAGVALGVYGGFFFEYHASPKLRVFGAPVPAAFFHWEGPPGHEDWVDFPAETALLNAASNVLLVPLLFACPLAVVFWSWHKLRS